MIFVSITTLPRPLNSASLLQYNVMQFVKTVVAM